MKVLDIQKRKVRFLRNFIYFCKKYCNYKSFKHNHTLFVTEEGLKRLCSDTPLLYTIGEELEPDQSCPYIKMFWCLERGNLLNSPISPYHWNALVGEANKFSTFNHEKSLCIWPA